MPLNALEAFKVGFLSRCVEAGLGVDEIAGCVKRARDMMEKHAGLIGDLGGGLKALGGGLLQYGVPLALAAPPILGGAAGYGLSRATDVDDTDVADIKNQEVIDEYRRQSERLKRQKAVRDYLGGGARPSRRLLM
jgi:hypothetical protein